MSATTYTASKSRSQGRRAWTVAFRHPVCRDEQGRLGMKVRRGLGTDDDVTADLLVKEMNILLSDQTYWSLAERRRAEQRFDSKVVGAFYDPMEHPAGPDPATIRDSVLPLPSKDDGYSRILLMGTTGVGKTSLLRHLMGTAAKRDRFPSTSTGKCTVADTEVITAHGEFEAVVTFFPKRQVRTYIEESILEASRTAWRDAMEEQIARDLLNHKEQRFRLGYILGSWIKSDPETDEDEWEEEEATELDDDELDAGPLPTDDERSAMQRQLETYVAEIRSIAKSADAELTEEFGEPLAKQNEADLDAAAALLVERIQEFAEYSDLVDKILGEVLRRFDHLAEGRLTTRHGWPEKWVFRSSDRDGFLRQIRWFSSNYHKEYGRLLTPVVQGIRVKGPFVANQFAEDAPRWVLIDGEGLGHTPDSVASVSTRYTSRYSDVDVILLVDNAQQPMQAGSNSVLRSVAPSGHHEKLVIAFTHFDAVKGDNLPTFQSKRNHVLASVKNTLDDLRESLGDVVVSSVERAIEGRCFMLGWLDQSTTEVRPGARKQLAALTRFFKEAIVPGPTTAARPLYDPAGLAFAVQSAAKDFHSRWDARLGHRRLDGVHKEHWTRVKALNRRVTERWNDCEYDNLRPIAELHARLQEEVSRFLDKPVRWNPAAEHPEEETAKLNAIRSEVFADLLSFTEERIVDQRTADWSRAYEYAGVGSAYKRADELRRIYGEAAPIPGTVITEAASEFLAEVRDLVSKAIRAGGGDLELL